MLTRRMKDLVANARVLTSSACIAQHKPACPANRGKGGGGKGGGASGPPLKRALKSGKCRMGFIPEEFFLFFKSKTGVSGPYVFLLVVTNYCVSKEVLVMEHEYYGGLSWLLVIYLIATRAGKTIGAHLDKGVDAIVDDYENTRKGETDFYETIIVKSKMAQVMAQGQKLLMDAKKENIALQLEAEFRERSMLVYRTVKGRMDYHVKRYYTEARIHQKWMIDWILSNVMKSITPDFEKRALDQAIQDLAAAASKA